MKNRVRLIAILLLSFASIFSVFKVGKVLAGEKVLKLIDAKITEKSSTTQASLENFSDDVINSNTTFHQLDDYVIYKLSVKNISKKNYTLKSVSDNNTNTNLVYEYTYDKDSSFNSSSTKDIILKITYKNELTDITKRDQDNDVKITITLDGTNGEIIINPQTHDNIIIYGIIFVISTAALVLLFIKNKKTKVVLLITGIMAPMLTYASFVGITIKLNTDVKLHDKLIVTYKVGDTVSTKVIPYNSKAEKPTAPSVDGYNFEGWYKGDTLFDFDNDVLNEDEVLTAKLTPINYTVACDLNGGTGTSSYNYNIESNSFTLARPTKTGFNFAGWTGTDITNPVLDVTISKGSTGNKNYTANYVARDDIPYTVNHRYENLDGTYTVSTLTPTGTTNTPYLVPTDCKYGFTCPTPEVVVVDGAGTSSVTYTYNRLSYSFSYSSDVTTTFTDPTYLYETPITVSYIPKTGYTFTKWSDNATDSPYTFNLVGDTDIYPVYEANKYNVIFNSNNVLAQTSTQELTYDTSSNLNNNSFIYPGYTFVKWNTLASGLGDDYSNGASVLNLSTGEDFNLYAKWSANTNTLYTMLHRYEQLDGTYDDVYVDGQGTTDTTVTPGVIPRTGYNSPNEEDLTILGTGDAQLTYVYTLKDCALTINDDIDTVFTDTTYKYGTTITLTAKDKDGYTFVKWSNDEVTKSISFNITEATYIYPIYEANKYNIIFNSNTTPNEVSSQELTYDTSSNLNANTFTKDGHTFASWNTSSDGNGTTYTDGQSVINLSTGDDINLYAMWNINSYTVSFDSMGGSSVDSITNTYGSELGTLEEPTKEGFTFDGWYTDPTGGTPIDEHTQILGTTTYYAHWTEITILCKKAQELHTQTCQRTSGGCFQQGYTVNGSMGTDIVTYGSVPYGNITSGNAYNCDVNGDGVYSDESERFYYLRTRDDKTVLIYSANMGQNGVVDNTHIFNYDVALTLLPTSALWSNVDEISDGKITRFASVDDLTAACSNCNVSSNNSLLGTLFLFENTKFVSTLDSVGRSAVWLEPVDSDPEEVGRRYHVNTMNVVKISNSTSISKPSENGVRPVIEVPLERMDKRITILFDTNGGEQQNSYKFIDSGSALTTLPTSTKADAIFDGWYTQAVGGDKISESTAPTVDTTYYAHYINSIGAAIISNESILLHPGESEAINITNAQEIGETYTFASGDDTIALVDANGLVTAQSVGQTTVIITGDDSGDVRVVTVAVEDFSGEHTVKFNSNGGNSIDPITVTDGDPIGALPTPIKSGSNFDAWYKDAEFTEIVTPETIVNEPLTLYAKWYSPDSVARIGHDYYLTLKDAVDHVPYNNVKTEVIALTDISEDVTIEVNTKQIVDLNLDGHTFNFTNSSERVFMVYGGELTLSSGTIKAKASQGMINAEPNGVINITGGTYNQTGSKQVVYNNGGVVTISGNPTLTSTTASRATVHNLNNGRMYIKGGTIISSGNGTNTNHETPNALYNASGTVEIGEKGGPLSTTSPSLQGNRYGVYGTNVYFYDGIIKGKIGAFNNVPDAAHLETGATIVDGTEGNFYTATLNLDNYIINLDPNGGTLDSNVMVITPGSALTNLPTPQRLNYTFDGWYTSLPDGVEVTNETIPDGNYEYIAKWTYNLSDEVVSFRTTNNAMKTYYSYIDSWKSSSTNFPSWSSSNKAPNWAFDATENTAMKNNFDNNNCMCADNQCSSGGTVECDKPKGFDTGYNEQVNVYTSDEITKAKGDLISYAKSENGVIYNLIPGEVYYWELDSDPTIHGLVKFTGERRILNTGDVRNTRDLGGMPADKDGDGTVDSTIKYGVLFRGIKLSSQSSVDDLRNLGITEELDLREANSDSYKLPKYKRIEAQNYFVNPDTQSTDELNYYNMTRAAVKYAMEEVVAGEKLYFHCRIGTDRTGTVAYVLEGLLGVPEEDRIRDYELSFFYGLIRIHRYHDEKPGSNVGTGKERFVYMHNFMATNQEIYEWYMAGTDNEQADKDLIQAFRNKVIE